MQSRYYDPEIGRFINADSQLSGTGGEIVGYNQFAYCFNNPVSMNDKTGKWPTHGWLSSSVKLLVNIVVGQVLRAGVKNAVSSSRTPNYEAVDRLLEGSVQTDIVSKNEVEVRSNNVRLPEDSKGLLYNKKNRMYASEKIKGKLKEDTKRTIENISSEIFAHQFAADICSPLSIFSGFVPADYDIYGRLASADIDENEGRIGIFDFMEGVLEWE